jgi:ketosteroid isomerase-like protein
MEIKSVKETVLKFIEAINNQDLELMAGLMTEKHVFIDASGSKYEGREGMLEGWKEYFKMFPDYNIEITDIIESDLIVGAFGYASGTYRGETDDFDSNYWEAPAAWKVIVEEEKIKYWQVFCDYTELYGIIGDPD